MNPILLASCRLRSGLRATGAPPCFNARSGRVAFTHRSEPRSNAVLEKQIPNSEYGSPLQRTARATPRVVEFATLMPVARHTPHMALPWVSAVTFLPRLGRRATSTPTASSSTCRAVPRASASVSTPSSRRSPTASTSSTRATHHHRDWRRTRHDSSPSDPRGRAHA